MTCGNGNDTFFLAKHARNVYAIDISKEAIIRTRERCKDFNNIIYINDDHQNIDKYIKDKIYLFIFNLGYLPDSSSQSLTKASTTLSAIKKAIELCNGYLVISFYRGQEGGKDEYLRISKYLIDNNILPIETYRQYRHENEPLTAIYKLNQKNQ